MPALRSEDASWCEEDNDVHCITILLSNLSFSDSDTSHSEEDVAAGERQEVLEGVDQPVGGNYREQYQESDEDGDEGWDGSSMSTENSLDRMEDSAFERLYVDLFMTASLPPPPFPFLWVLVFCTVQLFPWFCAYALIDACLKSLVLLASYILLRVLVSYLEEGQLLNHVNYQRRHRLRQFYRIV